MPKRKGVFCESCGNKSRKIKKRVSIPTDIVLQILSYCIETDELVEYETYYTIINISKSFKLAIEKIITEHIYEKDYWFIYIINDERKSMIMDYYMYLRNLKAISNIASTLALKNETTVINKKFSVIKMDERFKNIKNKVDSEVRLLKSLFNRKDIYGKYFLYKKDGVIHKRRRMYELHYTKYINCMLNITPLPINQIEYYSNKLHEDSFDFESDITNDGFATCPFSSYLNREGVPTERILQSIQEEIEKYPLIKEFLAIFDSVIGGSWPLYYILEKPKNWLPNNMNIYTYIDQIERVEEFLLCNGVEFKFVYCGSKIKFNIGDMKVKIYLREYDLPCLVHKEFDIDICKCFYNGKHIFTICPSDHLFNREMYVECNGFKEESRIKKYESRGFKVTKDKGY